MWNEMSLLMKHLNMKKMHKLPCNVNKKVSWSLGFINGYNVFAIISSDSVPRKVLASTSRLKSVLAGDNNMAFEN